jgi:thiol-disulfide isomerase/thioredoxin
MKPLQVAVFIVMATTTTAIMGGCKGASTLKPTTTQSVANAKPEPAVTFKDLNGSSLPLESLKGKVVLVNFWATWCEPCKIEIPWMIEFQQKYSGRGFTVVGVAMDEEGKSAVAPFVQKQQFDVNGAKMTMNYPIVLGNDDVAEKFGGLFGYPTSWLISRDGKVVKKIIGIVNESDLEKEIQDLLQQSSASTASVAPMPNGEAKN